MAIASSHLIFHSNGAREKFRKEIAPISSKKSTIIPHGSYIGVYPENPEIAIQLSQELDLGEQNRVVLYLGAIRKYKGILRLIESFKQTTDSSLRLIIAGKPR